MLRFTKLEGCGNDFVVVDLRAGEAGPRVDTPEVAEAICDRHFGVGGDGLLAIMAPTSEGAVARMRVLNADGSEAEMCGNGIRCVAKYLYERDAGDRPAEPPTQPLPLQLPIDTGAGLLRCGVTLDARRRVTQVSVAMGRPRLRAVEIPLTLPLPPSPDPGRGPQRAKVGPDEPVVDHEITLEGRSFEFTAVSMGNPHAVIFVGAEERETLRAIAERYGPALEKHPWFPRRTNAEFARVVEPGHIELVVWERGCGITLACGTGACATAVAACLTERASTGEEIRVSLLGGDLAITVDEGMTGVAMRGPANQVCEGDVDVAALLARHAARRGIMRGADSSAPS